MQVTGSGALRTVKKAPWREIEMPVDMLLYLMFTYIRPRAGLPRADDLARDARIELYKSYLADKVQWREIGRHVSKKIREEHEALRRENQKLKIAFENDRSAEQDLAAVCKALGVRGGSYNRAGECLKAIEAMQKNGGVSPAVQQAVARVKADAEILLNELELREASE